MRVIDAVAQAQLDQQYGTEPFFVLAVQWSGVGALFFDGVDFASINERLNTKWSYYGDKSYHDGENLLIDGRILSVSNIESVMNVDGNSDSAQIEIKLSDKDGSLLAFINSNDVAKRPAYLYQMFNGLELGNMFPIFQGEIVSDIVWSEADQSLTLNIVSRLEDIDIGFSPEEGDISDLPTDLIGQPWPFGIGLNIKSKALQINQVPVGITSKPLGIHDGSLNDEIGRIATNIAELRELADFYFKAALQALYSGEKEIGDQMTDLGNQCLILIDEQGRTSGSLSTILSAQMNYESYSCELIGDYPRVLEGTFDINGTTFTGKVSKSVNGVARFEIDSIYNALAKSGGLPTDGTSPQKAQFIYIQAGSQVKFTGPYPIRYIVNLLGGTIYHVYAYRQFEGLKRLTVVPQKYYNLHVFPDPVSHQVRGPDYSVIGIQLYQPLSNILLENWDDDLYVSFSSGVGPGLHDVLSFLISSYTPYAIDASQLYQCPNFNLNFVINETKNIFTILQEICYQCRMAIWLREGVFHFKYLPNGDDPVKTVSLSDIISNSLELTVSDTENLVTKMTALWNTDLSKEKPNKVTLRYNIARYGTLAKEDNFYAFNVQQSVEDSLSFWIYRLGNIWKKIKLKLPLKFLNIENFDTILLSSDVAWRYQLCNSEIRAIVKSNAYDAEDNTMLIELELPVKIGTMVEDYAYWPSGRVYYYATSVAIRNDNTGLPAHPWNGISPVQPTATPPAKYLTNSPNVETPDFTTGIPQMVGFISNKDYGGRMNDTPAAQLTVPLLQQTIVTQPAPFWPYNYGGKPVPPSQPDTASGGGVPGKIISGSGDTYECVVYPNGLGSASKNVSAKLLQKSPLAGEDVPADTWAIFAVAGKSYYFQIPIWFG